jgi:dolichyl-phosphate beta-glucosyltransferase
VPRPVKLSIVIPAYNEARRLPATLQAVSAYLAGRPDLDPELIVVDDGSTDGTVETLRQLPDNGVPPRILGFAGNRGKGAAVREGMLAASGDFVLFMDADNSTRVNEVEKLLEAAGPEHPVVIGSRYVAPGSIKIRQPWYRVAISRAGNRVIQLLLLPGIQDTQCGFKLFSGDAARELAGSLTMDGFSFDMELLAIAKRRGYPITEVPVNWYDTPGARLRPIRSTLQTFRDLLRIRGGLV